MSAHDDDGKRRHSDTGKSISPDTLAKQSDGRLYREAVRRDDCIVQSSCGMVTYVAADRERRASDVRGRDICNVKHGVLKTWWRGNEVKLGSHDVVQTKVYISPSGRMRIWTRPCSKAAQWREKNDPSDCAIGWK